MENKINYSLILFTIFYISLYYHICLVCNFNRFLLHLLIENQISVFSLLISIILTPKGLLRQILHIKWTDQTIIKLKPTSLSILNIGVIMTTVRRTSMNHHTFQFIHEVFIGELLLLFFLYCLFLGVLDYYFFCFVGFVDLLL